MTFHYSCVVALHIFVEVAGKKVGNSRNLKVKVGTVGAGSKK